MTQHKFSDINTLMGVTSNKDILHDEGALINTLVNIMMIPKRTRKFRREFGSSAYDYLHRPVSTMIAMQLRESLLADFQQFQPLAKMTHTDIDLRVNRNMDGYDLRISYTSSLTNSRNIGVFNLIAYEPI